MPYGDSTDSGSAADDLNNPPDDQGGSFYLPSDFPGAENLKPGDTITLTIVGKDADGDIEVQPAESAGATKKGMMDHFDEEVK